MGWQIRPTCPFKRKYELINWAIRNHPEWTTTHINKLSKKQLYAIWYKT